MVRISVLCFEVSGQHQFDSGREQLEQLVEPFVPVMGMREIMLWHGLGG